MFHHIVFFYLKKDITSAQRAEFETKLRGLLAIKSIHSGYVGIPSKHAVRPIIDTSYDFAEFFVFKNHADHDAYQIDPIHQAFIAEEIELAVNQGVTVVVDNARDLELLAEIAPGRPAPVRLLLRFTPGIECHTHEYIRTGHLDSKFGFDPDQLETVLRQLADCPWARLDGLHAHIGSQIFELEPHRDLAGVMADALAQGMESKAAEFQRGGGELYIPLKPI